jgi:hypothetical protein
MIGSWLDQSSYHGIIRGGNSMKTFNIRVRAEYVNQYTIEAEDLNQAEAIAQQNTYEEMDTNWEFGSMDFEEFELED